ncbi:AsnC-type helix-turn-helix domain protein [uncultured archaeon]|nr:AsnC-type helix-turn-helix domain protein [uncultured archaeon]
MELDVISRRVIRELCMDSRVPVSVMAERIGCSRSTVASRIRFVEKTAGLKYVVEPDMARLGLNFSYFIGVKLRRELPEKDLIPLLEESPIPQFAAFCKGEFDLLLFAAARNELEFMRWAFNFRSALSDEIVSWNASHLVFARYGVFPLNDATLARSTLPSPKKALLMELNRDSSQKYKELARRLKTTVPSLRYYFRLLEKSGCVKRFTAFMQNPMKSVHLVNFRHYTYQAEHEEMSKRDRVLIKTEEPYQVPNTNSFVVETAGAADAFHWVSADDVKAAYAELKKAEQLYQGYLRTESAIVEKVIYGLWPVRALDMEKVYDSSSWDKREDMEG